MLAREVARFDKLFAFRWVETEEGKSKIRDVKVVFQLINENVMVDSIEGSNRSKVTETAAFQ